MDRSARAVEFFLIIGMDNEVSARRNAGAGRESPFEWSSGIIAESPTGEIDAASARVMKLNPIREVDFSSEDFCSSSGRL